MSVFTRHGRVGICFCTFFCSSVSMQKESCRKCVCVCVSLCTFEPDLNELSSHHTQALADCQFQSTLDISVTECVTSNFVMEKKGWSL